MKKVRRGIFETNSSSSHSISIASGDNWAGKITDNITIETGEYGWEYERYSDFYSKASYALTWCKQYGSEQQVSMLRKVIKEYTGSKKVTFKKSGGDGEWDYDWGYIDYRSNEVGEEAFKDEKTLKQFLFNRASVVITDNDNH